MIALIVKTLLSYLIGSLLGSLVVGRICGRGDIRASGSGNPGSTNALRTHGKLFALGVAVIDVGKGWIATGLLPTLALSLPPSPGSMRDWVPAACGAGVMLGHVFPVWFGFRGGKAVATFFGATVGLVPGLGLAALLIWGGVLVLTGFVGLASMIAAVSLPVLLASDGLASHRPYLTFAVYAALLIVATHRANIARMRAGHEPRAQRVWLLGRRVPS